MQSETVVCFIEWGYSTASALDEANKRLPHKVVYIYIKYYWSFLTANNSLHMATPVQEEITGSTQQTLTQKQKGLQPNSDGHMLQDLP